MQIDYTDICVDLKFMLNYIATMEDDILIQEIEGIINEEDQDILIILYKYRKGLDLKDVERSKLISYYVLGYGMKCWRV